MTTAFRRGVHRQREPNRFIARCSAHPLSRSPSSTNHSTCVRALSAHRANISGGASRSVAVLAIEAANALGPNTSVLFASGGSKPDEMGLGLFRCRVWPLTGTAFSVRHIAGADRRVLTTRSPSDRPHGTLPRLRFLLARLHPKDSTTAPPPVCRRTERRPRCRKGRHQRRNGLRMPRPRP